VKEEITRKEFLRRLGLTAAAAVGVGLGRLGMSDSVAATSTSTPVWVKGLPDRILRWQQELRGSEYWGLCRDCIDAETPFAFPASSVVLGWLRDFGMLERVPGYSRDEVRRTAGYVTSCQQPDTGLFIDPHLDERFANKGDKAAYRQFREAVTKYSIGLLTHLGTKPKYPFTVTGDTGVPDGDKFINYVQSCNWDHPWDTGSVAGGMAREVFLAVENGHKELIPALCKGVEIIMSHQNPKTGMIGASSIPLSEQISGSLKVYPRLIRWLGVNVPHLDRLADSCIAHHADQSFYVGCGDMCIPRNVLEMCALCLEDSDYRRDELLATIGSVVERIRGYQMPDGLFASSTDGKGPIGWGGALVAAESDKPRSNVNGTQAAVWALGIAGAFLGWKDAKLANPLADWRERRAQYKNRVRLTADGKAEVVSAAL